MDIPVNVEFFDMACLILVFKAILYSLPLINAICSLLVYRCVLINLDFNMIRILFKSKK